MMSTIDVHGAGPTDTFSAASSEGEGWIDLIFNFDESIEEHRSALVGIDVVRHILGPILWVIWIRSENVESLHLGFLFCSQTLIELLGIVNFENIWCVADTDIGGEDSSTISNHVE